MILIFVDEMNIWTCGLTSIVRRRTIEMILMFVDKMNMWTCGLISIVRRRTIEMILISVCIRLEYMNMWSHLNRPSMGD
jgi:hypothetical protein